MIGSEEFAYALGAMVCYGLADLVYKRAAMAGVRVPQFLMLQAWFFAPAVLTYALAKDELHVVPAAAWGAAAGLCIFIGFANFAKSLRDGAISVNAPIFRLSFTYPTPTRQRNSRRSRICLNTSLVFFLSVEERSTFSNQILASRIVRSRTSAIFFPPA